MVLLFNGSYVQNFTGRFRPIIINNQKLINLCVFFKLIMDLLYREFIKLSTESKKHYTNGVVLYS